MMIDQSNYHRCQELVYEAINHYQEFTNAFDALEKQARLRTKSIRLAQGGLTLRCGYYCPNPIYDLVIGGARRGRLLPENTKARKIDYTFLLDERGKLVCAEKYLLGRKHPCFLVPSETITWYLEFDDQRELRWISAAEYHDEKIQLDITLDCLSNGLFSGIYEAWTFEYLSGHLTACESYSGSTEQALNRFGCDRTSKLLLVDNLPYDQMDKYSSKYVLQLDTEHRLIEYEYLLCDADACRSRGLYQPLVPDRML